MTTIDLYKDISTLKTHKLKLTTESPFTPQYVQNSVTLSNDPQEIYRSRVLGRQMLLENPARVSRARKEAEEKQERRKKHKERAKLGIVGRREGKERGLWALEPEQRKFSLFVPLHNLWLGYMSELLGLPQASSSTQARTPSSSTMHPKLVKADFHGSVITVKQAKNPSLVGLQGIIIHETENAFKVITKDDKLKMLPKQNTIFTFPVPLYSTLSSRPQAPEPLTSDESPKNDQPLQTVLDQPHLLFTLYGNQFRFRSADRASRKFKPKMSVEL